MKRPDLLSLQRPRFRSAVLPWLCAAGAGLAASQAVAQSSPYSLTLGQRFGVDSNIFRVPDSAGKQRDYTSITSISVGLDQPISRQRLYGRATAEYTAYKGNDQLNGPGYELLAGLGWEIGSRLSGDVSVALRQSQASLADYGALASTARSKNRERSAVFDFRGIYGGTGLLAPEVLYNHIDVSYSNPAFATRERQSDTVGAGLRVRTSPNLTYGVVWRETRGEYPQGVALIGGGFAADEYDRSDIDLTAAYRLSDITRFSGRLTYTKEDHDQVGTRSFSGITGEFVIAYRPSGKLELGLGYSRDTGSGSSLAALTGTGSTSTTSTGTGTTGTSSTGTTSTGTTTSGAGSTIAGSGLSTSTGYLSDARVSDQLRLEALWEATAKVRITGTFSYSWDRYDSLFVVGSTGTLGQDRGNTLGLRVAANYEFSRGLNFQCGIGRDSRDAGSGIGSGYDFTANTAFCGATLRLQ